MPKLSEKITALREALLEVDSSVSDSFSEVFGRFLDLTETTNLFDVCDRYADQALRVLLEQIAREHAKDPKLALVQAQMHHHVASGLVHGVLFTGRHPGSFFFFLQEQRGIVAFIESMTVTHYYRVTATELPPGMVLGRKRKRWSSKGLRN